MKHGWLRCEISRYEDRCAWVVVQSVVAGAVEVRVDADCLVWAGAAWRLPVAIAAVCRRESDPHPQRREVLVDLGPLYSLAVTRAMEVPVTAGMDQFYVVAGDVMGVPE